LASQGDLGASIPADPFVSPERSGCYHFPCGCDPSAQVMVMARWTAPLLIGFVFAGLIGMGIWHIRQHLPTPQEWARLLEAEWTKALAMPVQVEAATVGLTGAILHKLRIQPDSRSPTGYLLTVPKLWLRWSVRQWLRPSEWRRTVQAQLERALHQIVVSNAILFLWRDRRGVWNWQPMWATRPIRRPMRFPLIKIHNGEIVLGDETLPLPDGTPFRLHLVAVDATVKPSEGGILIEAQGRLKEPLGAPNSWVSVTIRQVSLEGMQERHGRLQLSRLRLSALPQKWRHFAEGQVRDGEMVNAVLHWHQTDAETSLSGTATLLRLSARHPRIHLAPLDVEVALALHFVHPKPPSWQVNLRTLKVHPQLGSGMVALEGQQGFWRIRWRGEQVPIAILQLLVPKPLPLHGGTVKGWLAAEIRKRRWQVDADVTVQKTALRLEGEGTGDKGQVKEGQLLAIAVPHGRGQVRLEQNGNRWHGTVEMAAETAIGKVSAFLWLRDFGGTKEGQGRAIVKVQNLRLKAFRSLLDALLPKQWRQKVQLHDGFVTGEAAVGWRGRRWWLEGMSGRFSEVALDSPHFPPLRASAQIRADGQRMHFSSLQVQFDRRVLAQFSGQTTLERQPLWQVQGQLSPDAIERLSAWAMARWKLPVHLLTGGKGKFTEAVSEHNGKGGCVGMSPLAYWRCRRGVGSGLSDGSLCWLPHKAVSLPSTLQPLNHCPAFLSTRTSCNCRAGFSSASGGVCGMPKRAPLPSSVLSRCPNCASTICSFKKSEPTWKDESLIKASLNCSPATLRLLCQPAKSPTGNFGGGKKAVRGKRQRKR